MCNYSKLTLVRCACKLGFLGSRCQLTDFCPTRPCGNNGSFSVTELRWEINKINEKFEIKGACFPVIRNITIGFSAIEQVTYYCQCYKGFQGFNCQDRMYLFGFLVHSFLSLLFLNYFQRFRDK